MKEFQVESRSSKETRGSRRRLRKSGRIPCVVYGEKKTPQTFSVCQKNFLKELSHPGIKTRVFQLEGVGPVLVKAMQFLSTKDVPIHIDFLHAGASVHVHIPVIPKHEDSSVGLKRGGILNWIHHTVEVSVPSASIPQGIEVDLSTVDIGHAVHLSDLQLPHGVKVLHLKPEEPIISIVAPSSEASVSA